MPALHCPEQPLLPGSAGRLVDGHKSDHFVDRLAGTRGNRHRDRGEQDNAEGQDDDRPGLAGIRDSRQNKLPRQKEQQIAA